MILEEIAIGKTEESKRVAIQKNLGQQVILNDNHNYWCHGVILEKGFDDECYKMKIADARGNRQLHYHDLKQLLIIRNHPTYQRPKID